jgi:hypothetical protein
MLLRIYNTYFSDKNISIYFELAFNINEGDNFIKFMNLKEIKLISMSNINMNKRIILNCFDNNNAYLNKKIEFYKYYAYLFPLINELNNKYELFMLYTFDIIKLSETPNSVFVLNECVEIINHNGKNKEEDYFELSIEKKKYEFI